jgi:hypothetical protein
MFVFSDLKYWSLDELQRLLSEQLKIVWFLTVEQLRLWAAAAREMVAKGKHRFANMFTDFCFARTLMRKRSMWKRPMTNLKTSRVTLTVLFVL